MVVELPLVAPGGAVRRSGEVEVRVLAAALACFGRWGLTKTTLDDVAKAAGCSRATVYRLYPGGKPALQEAVGEHEVARLLALVTEAADRAEDLVGMVTDVIVTAAAFIEDHQTLQYLIRHEPERLAPFLAFDNLDPLLEAARSVLAPSIARVLDPLADPVDAGAVVEWAVRIVVSYTFTPWERVDLTDASAVGRLVTTYLIPGIAAAMTAHDSTH